MLQKITLTALAFGALLTASIALAQTNPASTTPLFKPLPVIFPIAALGGCDSKDACRVYCDIAANRDACYAYAQTHGMMSTTSIMLAKRLQTVVGPGGCQGEACKQYCDDSTHAQLCVAFAQQNGFISKDDADKRMQHMNISSTTRPLLIPVNGTGTVASSTSGERPDIHPARTLKPPPPHHGDASSTGQSSSIFFAVLHFFGL